MAKLVKTKRDNKRVTLIKKANELVEARYKFDIWEMRVFSKMITMIETEDADFQDYKIYLKDFIKDYSLEGDKESYRWLRQGARKLMEKVVTIFNKTEDGKTMKFETPVVAGLETFLHDEEGKFVQVSFHPRMKPYLLELKSRFLVYDVKNILKLPSTYSIRIYELLKQYERIGERKFAVKELKEILGINREYKLYGHFKDRVIDKAQSDLKTFTDIQFTYTEVKKGKAVEVLVFQIRQNVPPQQPKQKKMKVLQPMLDFGMVEDPSVSKGNYGDSEPITIRNSDLFEEIFPQVKHWGVSVEVLNLLVETQPEEYIREGLAYTKWEEKANKIKDNAAGFFINAVKNRYTSRGFEDEKKKAKRLAEQQAKEVRIKELTIQHEALTEEFQSRVNDVIRELTVRDYAVTERAIAAVKLENKMYLTVKKVNPDELSVEEFRKDKILRGLVIHQIQLQNPDFFKGMEDAYKPQITALEEEIKGLRK